MTYLPPLPGRDYCLRYLCRVFLASTGREMRGAHRLSPRREGRPGDGGEMLHWLRRILPRGREGGRLDAQLAALEAEARLATWPARAELHNRAADLCAAAGDRDRAQAHLGRAIDAFLEAGALESAAAMCRKLIRLSPEVVRAHCTLAFLSVRDGRMEDAGRAIADYVTATRRTRTEHFAVPRLRMLGDCVPDPAIRRQVADALREMRDADGARAILAALDCGDDCVPGKGCDAESWMPVFRAAVMDPPEPARRAAVAST